MAFRGLNKLDELDISRNQLTMAPSLLYMKNTLQILDISWNKITHISGKYFNLCRKIKMVYLGFNQLTEIPNVQTISQTIIFLSLASNNISDVTSIYGTRFPMLQILYLSSNQIRSFCLPPVEFAPRLHEVSLESNITSVIDFTYTKGPRLLQVKVYLAHNPWHCNGSLYWTQQCTQWGHDSLNCMSWLLVDGMVCVSPLEAQGLTPKEAGRFSMYCLPKELCMQRCCASFVGVISLYIYININLHQWRGLCDPPVCLSESFLLSFCLLVTLWKKDLWDILSIDLTWYNARNNISIANIFVFCWAACLRPLSASYLPRIHIVVS